MEKFRKFFHKLYLLKKIQQNEGVILDGNFVGPKKNAYINAVFLEREWFPYLRQF